jgi:hypothetical protein
MAIALGLTIMLIFSTSKTNSAKNYEIRLQIDKAIILR